MNVINWYNKLSLEYIGGYQPIDENLDVKYRFSKFVIVYDIDDGYLLMNTLLGSLVLVSRDEYNNVLTDRTSDWSTYLYKTYFVVKEGFNEDKIVDMYAKQCDEFFRKDVNKDTLYKDINVFTIATTSKCNARCFYCFEHKEITNKKHMSLETAKDVVDFMLTRIDKENPVYIQWFGGEPFYNMDIIDYVSNRLNEEGIEWSSDAVSNGYYLTKDVIKKAKDQWHLTKVQITLDGTKNQYNKIKNYIEDDQNPYKHVINNISNLLKSDIFVSIRLNCHENNVDDISKLVDILIKRFGKYENFSIYATPLFSDLSKKEITTDNFINIFLKIREKISDYLFEQNKEPEMFRQYFCGLNYNVCMGVTNKCIMINHDGNIFNCQHWNRPVGSIYSDNYDVEYITNFIKNRSFNDICSSCKLRPTCISLHKCAGNVSNGCIVCKTENDKKIRKHLLDLSVSYLFRKYMIDNIEVLNIE